MTRILVVLAALMGAAGVALAAAAAHLAHDSGLEAASSMLLFHAPAVLATALLVDRGLVGGNTGNLAGFGFVVAATLFAGDLSMRQFAGHRLFPFAAPIGGTLLIASWLVLAVCAAWPRRRM
jgi:uncharacterized membrane protein YgdD (TMEM256/DUF423 family)